jgi:hypothetical protein
MATAGTGTGGVNRLNRSSVAGADGVVRNLTTQAAGGLEIGFESLNDPFRSMSGGCGATRAIGGCGAGASAGPGAMNGGICGGTGGSTSGAGTPTCGGGSGGTSNSSTSCTSSAGGPGLVVIERIG